MTNSDTVSAQATELCSRHVGIDSRAYEDLLHLNGVMNRLLSAVEKGCNQTDTWREIGSILSSEFPADFLSVVYRDNTSREFRIDGLLAPADGLQPALRNRLQAAGQTVCDSNSPLFIDGTPENGTVIALRIGMRSGRDHALVAYFISSVALTTRAVAHLHIAAECIGVWNKTNEVKECRQRIESLAAVIDLVDRISVCRTLESACQRLAGEIQQHIDCREFYVARPVKQDDRFQLAAVSDGSTITLNAQLVSVVESACEEAAMRRRPGMWPPHQRDIGGLCIHRRLMEEIQASEVVSVPLIDDRGVIQGAWIAVFRDRPSSNEEQLFLRVAAAPVASLLAVLQRAERHWVVRQLAPIFERTWWKKKSSLLSIASLALCSMFLPVPHVVTCECELQPVTRRFVAPQFDGKLEKSFVKPGDIVTRDALLLKLDASELRMEEAGLEAERHRITKKRDGEIVERNFGAASVSRHELSRIESRLELITSRYRNLEVRSPIDGIIVTGDLQRAEGMPLKRGQTLFEIAPLNEMVVELSIPEPDIGYVRAGMPVDITFESAAVASLSSELKRIHPRAELRNQSHVFIGESVLKNDRGFLRPGMHGWAQVKAGRCLLGWRLFHRFWERIRILAGW